jgi:hypothetical protein
MSNTAIEFRAPSVARPTAQRVHDGVVAGYIRTLAGASSEPAEQRESRQARTRDCESGRPARASRTGAAAARRRPARRGALLSA